MDSILGGLDQVIVCQEAYRSISYAMMKCTLIRCGGGNLYLPLAYNVIDGCLINKLIGLGPQLNVYHMYIPLFGSISGGLTAGKYYECDDLDQVCSYR